MKNNLNLAFLFGTRPELIKIAPVYKDFIKNTRHQGMLISTGQHKEQLEENFKIFKIEPDFDLKLMKKKQQWTSFLMDSITKIESKLREVKPDCLFVQGDTISALSGAIVSNYLKIPLAHIEAGLRTHCEDQPFPEEINRVLIAQMANFNFAPTQIAKNNLLEERVPAEKIYLTGNTVVDSVHYVKVNKCKNYLKNEKVLITLHRQDSIPFLKGMVKKIANFATHNKNLEFVFPIHLNPSIRNIVKPVLGSLKNISIIEQTNYENLLRIMQKSMFIISDSGGLQEEAATLNIPLAIARDFTEREEGLDNKISVLLGREEEIFEKNLNNFFNKIRKKQIHFNENIYGDGHASKRITNIINESYGYKTVHKDINPEYKNL